MCWIYNMNHAIKEWMPHLWKGGVPHWYYDFLLKEKEEEMWFSSMTKILTQKESLKKQSGI